MFNKLSKKEKWKDIPGYEGLYQISSWVRVWSVPRIVDGTRNGKRTRIKVKGRFLRAANSCGRMVVNLSKNNKPHMFSVHVLVLTVFIGPCPEGMEGCHEDGDFTNNRVDNLRWDTHQENQRDMVRHGTTNFMPGENHPNAKLTEEQVREIRRMYATGEWTQKELMSHFDVASIQAILEGKVWRTVS